MLQAISCALHALLCGCSCLLSVDRIIILKYYEHIPVLILNITNYFYTTCRFYKWSCMYLEGEHRTAYIHCGKTLIMIHEPVYMYIYTSWIQLTITYMYIACVPCVVHVVKSWYSCISIIPCHASHAQISCIVCTNHIELHDDMAKRGCNTSQLLNARHYKFVGV